MPAASSSCVITTHDHGTETFKGNESQKALRCSCSSRCVFWFVVSSLGAHHTPWRHNESQQVLANISSRHPAGPHGAPCASARSARSSSTRRRVADPSSRTNEIHPSTRSSSSSRRHYATETALTAWRHNSAPQSWHLPLLSSLSRSTYKVHCMGTLTVTSPRGSNLQGLSCPQSD